MAAPDPASAGVPTPMCVAPLLGGASRTAALVEATNRPTSDAVRWALRASLRRGGDAILIASRSATIWLQEPLFGAQDQPERRSDAVHPPPPIRCEHMFPSWRTFALAQQALAAFRLTRSFLLLEDDDCVDWEVDWSESAGARPERAPLRERISRRQRPRQRQGQPTPVRQICVFTAGPAMTNQRRQARREVRDRISPYPHRSNDASQGAPCMTLNHRSCTSSRAGRRQRACPPVRMA
jgi:hypothetical protein